MLTNSIALAQPPRNNSLVYKLAIQNGNVWQYFAQNSEATPHRLSFSDDGFTIYIGVPKYPHNRRQVLFVRTSYMQNQPVSLFRNSSNLFFQWIRDWRSNQTVLEKNYIEFHVKNLNDLDLSSHIWKPFITWHNTGFWRANEKTYDFVKKIVAFGHKQKPVAERLLKLKPNRSKMSWIEINTHSPDRDNLLTVTTSYSGTLDNNPSIKLYNYYFIIEN